MISLQDRQKADEALFGSSFNLDHNLRAYNELIAEKYARPDTVNAVFNDTEIQGTVNNESVDTDAYINMHAVHLENYYTPAQTGTQPASSFNRTAELEKYYNSNNPLPTQTSFRPKVLDAVLEVEVANSDMKTVKNNHTVREQAEETNANTESEILPNFKLNAKGMIAVISFIAVVVLVIALIIVNSVSISNANSRIKNLRVSNSEITERLNEKIYERNETLKLKSEEARDQALDSNGNPINGYEYVGQPIIIDIPAWTPQGNQDYSTNFFDKISRFFSRLFN